MGCYMIISKLTGFSSIVATAQGLWNGTVRQGFVPQGKTTSLQLPVVDGIGRLGRGFHQALRIGNTTT